MSKWKQALAVRLARAREREGVPQRVDLGHGLVIEVTQQANGELVTTLERRDVDPSENEARTVLKHWPEPVDAGVDWTAHKTGRLHRLTARWPRPVVALEVA